MKTFHIHIEGIVQGVGFRPFVYRIAVENNLKGWVNNTNDGLHIQINANRVSAEIFLKKLLNNLPSLAVVTDHTLREIPYQDCDDFAIVQSKSTSKPRLLLTPDVSICEDCKRELYDTNNRRFQYPFITCTNCGPRYSIIKDLPYDRFHTTMDMFQMCDTCREEYNDPLERRHFSQTNSCPNCRVEMQLYENGHLRENFTDLNYIIKKWNEGKIIAIKGIGGYLLTCDATKGDVIANLRERKQRPAKPFALMYPNLKRIKEDAELHQDEQRELENIYAPIVLLSLRSDIKKTNHLALEQINKGLSRIGVMLPYTPLFDLLLNKFDKPIIATSGNITNSTIIYKDQTAIEELSKIADIVLLNNREILIPQDDGVLQFSKKSRQKITLRRSRGKAPVYINPNLKIPKETVFASGSMLKSVFGLFNLQYIYLSQYLGNTASYDAQLNYKRTFDHFTRIFRSTIDAVIVDRHPDYFSTRFAEELAQKNKAEIYTLQHHKAHFYSVLGEHNLLDKREKVLGVIWDGTGLGDDGSIWGGEFFVYEHGKVDRIFHVNEFDFILGDKMAKEPKISAMAIAHQIKGTDKYLRNKFSNTEWRVYKKMLSKKSNLKSSSMGRIFDAVSSLLLNIDVHSFEAEASMKLESEASNYYYKTKVSISESYLYDQILPDNFVEAIIEKIIDDMDRGTDRQYIGVRFHITLVDYIIRIANKLNMNKLAFSGGVFQNALLVDMIIDLMDKDFELYFHNEFSPNDEGIPFGQLMYYSKIRSGADNDRNLSTPV